MYHKKNPLKSEVTIGPLEYHAKLDNGNSYDLTERAREAISMVQRYAFCNKYYEIGTDKNLDERLKEIPTGLIEVIGNKPKQIRISDALSQTVLVPINKEKQIFKKYKFR